MCSRNRAPQFWVWINWPRSSGPASSRKRPGYRLRIRTATTWSTGNHQRRALTAGRNRLRVLVHRLRLRRKSTAKVRSKRRPTREGSARWRGSVWTNGPGMTTGRGCTRVQSRRRNEIVGMGTIGMTTGSGTSITRRVAVENHPIGRRDITRMSRGRRGTIVGWTLSGGKTTTIGSRRQARASLRGIIRRRRFRRGRSRCGAIGRR
uniref:(northern house mosquito) hypothetical protein n=1 Tax=Culex pipiens TaxID=7175 RepID=A0A8D8BNZ9_CULPI